MVHAEDPLVGAESASTDVSALDRLAQSVLRDLRIYVRRRFKHDEDTEDIVQEAFLRVWKNRGAVPFETARPYMFRVASNLALDRIRERDRWRREPVDDRLIDADAISAERTVAAREELMLIEREIETLPANCRLAFTLCRLEGRNHAEAAALMGISKSMVEKHVAEAVFRLGRARARARE